MSDVGLRRAVGGRPPQPLRHVALGNAAQVAGNASAPEILLGQHVGRDLAPVGRNFDAGLLEDDLAVRATDLGIGNAERHSCEWRCSCSRVPTLEAHRPKSPVPISRLLALSRGAFTEIGTHTYRHVEILSYKILCVQLHFVEQYVDGTT